MSANKSAEIKVRPIQDVDKARWLELWNGYLTFYKTSVPDEQTERTWQRILDPEFNMKCAVAEINGQVKIGRAHV